MSVINYDFHPRQHREVQARISTSTLLDALHERDSVSTFGKVVNLAAYREQQMMLLRIGMEDVELLARLRRSLVVLTKERKRIFLKYWDTLSRAEQTAALWHLILNVSPTRDFRWGDILYAVKVGYKKMQDA